MKTIYTLLILLLPIIGISQKVVSDQDVPKKDVIHNDDVIIDGSLNVGLDAIPNRAFGFDTQILSENNLRILFEDTSNSASFPSNDWRITINGSNNGDPSFFSIDDVDGGRVPFRIEAAARTNALYIESDGDIGIGTNNPAVDIDVKTGNTPTLRFQQDGTDGFTPQTWDIAGNETNFFVRDATNASKLPFRIRPNASTSSLEVRVGEVVVNDGGGLVDLRVESDTVTNAFFVDDTSGYVGIWTDDPTAHLHVVGDMAKTGQIIGASDERIKDNVQSIDKALDIIKNLDGKQYTYKKEAFPQLNLPSGQQYGLIAQDVENVVGHLVEQEFMNTEDEDGTDITLKGVKYEQLIPFLINAIKEQDKVITSQQALISQLMSQSASTEERLAKLESLLSGASKSTDSTKASSDKMED